jgi:hypothetical protein
MSEPQPPTIDLNGVQAGTRDLPARRAPDDATEPIVAGTLPNVPGFRLETELGRGGMGVVYRAWQVPLQRTVALKMVLAGDFARPDQVQRFVHEATAIAGLQHPHIVQVYETGQFEQRPFLVLEYISGGSLTAKIAQRLAPQQAAQILERLTQAVAYAHEQGIIHRDLKPDNVLLAPGVAGDANAIPGVGVPKLTDFGLARRVVGGAGLTASEAVMGTPAYMAPEQARGETAQAGPAADVWSLGAILYTLLAGREPFVGGSPYMVVLAVLHDPPPPLRQLNPAVPHALVRIVERCLEKEPADRYPSAAALVDDLHRFLANQPLLHARRRWPLRPVWLALAAVGLGAVAAGGWWLRSTRIPPAEPLVERLPPPRPEPVVSALELELRRLLQAPQLDLAAVSALVAGHPDDRSPWFAAARVELPLRTGTLKPADALIRLRLIQTRHEGVELRPFLDYLKGYAEYSLIAQPDAPLQLAAQYTARAYAEPITAELATRERRELATRLLLTAVRRHAFNPSPTPLQPVCVDDIDTLHHACEWLEAVLRIAPNHAEARAWLALIRAHGGQKARAHALCPSAQLPAGAPQAVELAWLQAEAAPTQSARIQALAQVVEGVQIYEAATTGGRPIPAITHPLAATLAEVYQTLPAVVDPPLVPFVQKLAERCPVPASRAAWAAPPTVLTAPHRAEWAELYAAVTTTPLTPAQLPRVQAGFTALAARLQAQIEQHTTGAFPLPLSALTEALALRPYPPALVANVRLQQAQVLEAALLREQVLNVRLGPTEQALSFGQVVLSYAAAEQFYRQQRPTLDQATWAAQVPHWLRARGGLCRTRWRSALWDRGPLDRTKLLAAALASLDELLATDSADVAAGGLAHEVRYLRGMCLSSLGRPETQFALEQVAQTPNSPYRQPAQRALIEWLLRTPGNDDAIRRWLAPWEARDSVADKRFVAVTKARLAARMHDAASALRYLEPLGTLVMERTPDTVLAELLRIQLRGDAPPVAASHASILADNLERTCLGLPLHLHAHAHGVAGQLLLQAAHAQTNELEARRLRTTAHRHLKLALAQALPSQPERAAWEQALAV